MSQGLPSPGTTLPRDYPPPQHTYPAEPSRFCGARRGTQAHHGLTSALPHLPTPGSSCSSGSGFPPLHSALAGPCSGHTRPVSNPCYLPLPSLWSSAQTSRPQRGLPRLAVEHGTLQSLLAGSTEKACISRSWGLRSSPMLGVEITLKSKSL